MKIEECLAEQEAFAYFQADAGRESLATVIRRDINALRAVLDVSVSPQARRKLRQTIADELGVEG